MKLLQIFTKKKNPPVRTTCEYCGTKLKVHICDDVRTHDGSIITCETNNCKNGWFNCGCACGTFHKWLTACENRGGIPDTKEKQEHYLNVVSKMTHIELAKRGKNAN